MHITLGVVLSLTGAVLSCALFGLAFVALLQLGQAWVVERREARGAFRERLERWGAGGWALEIDRNKEGVSIIREKATAYRRVATDPDFYARYGRMPIPLWVVPNAARADVINRAWAAVWPEGRWYIITDAHLQELRGVEWNAGQQRTAGLLDGWGG